MTKKQSEFDRRNPFIPSYSPVCQITDRLLVGSVAVAGIVAAALAVAHQMGAFQ